MSLALPDLWLLEVGAGTGERDALGSGDLGGRVYNGVGPDVMLRPGPFMLQLWVHWQLQEPNGFLSSSGERILQS